MHVYRGDLFDPFNEVGPYNALTASSHPVIRYTNLGESLGLIQ